MFKNTNLLTKMQISFSAQKTKGRTRMKMNAAMFNTAKHLVLQGATTSQLGEHLHISRTFAWRLRKTILNDGNIPLADGDQQPILIDSQDEDQQ